MCLRARRQRGIVVAAQDPAQRRRRGTKGLGGGNRTRTATGTCSCDNNGGVSGEACCGISGRGEGSGEHSCVWRPQGWVTRRQSGGARRGSWRQRCQPSRLAQRWKHLMTLLGETTRWQRHPLCGLTPRIGHATRRADARPHRVPSACEDRTFKVTLRDHVRPPFKYPSCLRATSRVVFPPQLGPADRRLASGPPLNGNAVHGRIHHPRRMASRLTSLLMSVVTAQAFFFGKIILRALLTIL